MSKYWIGFLSACLLLSACGSTTINPEGAPLGQSPEPSTKLTIVTTFFPYYVFTKNLAGDKAEVISLIDNAVGPHEYQLKPSDVKNLQSADLVIKNGLGLDDWVDQAVQNSGGKAHIFTASKGVSTLASVEAMKLVEGSGEEESGEEEGPNDPHVWVSPKNVLKILPAIATELMRLDPGNSAYYEDRFANYLGKITALDLEITQKFAGLQKKAFVSFHDAFQYFIRDYGLMTTLPIQIFPGKEPTPRYIEKLINFIKNNNIKAVFSEPQFSPAIVNSLAEQLQLEVESLDPLETGHYTPTAYEDITRDNVNTIAHALSL